MTILEGGERPTCTLLPFGCRQEDGQGFEKDSGEQSGKGGYRPLVSSPLALFRSMSVVMDSSVWEPTEGTG